MATCTKCGKSNYEGVKYCTACGTPLSTSHDSSSNDEEININNETQASSTKPIQSNEPKPKTKGPGIDPKILYAVIGIVILGLLIFVVKYFFLGKNNQTEVHFNASKTELFIEEEVTFTDNTANATSWDWDFGDESQEVGIDKVVNHIFVLEGTFWVKLTINGKYTDSIKITVTRKPLLGETRKNIQISITGPSRVKVGQQVTFTDNTPDATKWIWRMGESGETDGEEKSITYVFKTPGRKEISVSNDIAIKNGTLNVIVAAVPPGGGKAPAVPTSTLIAKLQSIADGNMDTEFDKFVANYLCNDPTIPVICNGKPVPSFYLFCQDLSFQKGQKILSVDMTKDNSNNCISQLSIKTK